MVHLPTSASQDAALALEYAAGGKLYDLVVQNEVVGSMLLQKGRLRRRVTIIPLSKIQPTRAAEEKVQAAKALTPGRAELALRLIGHDEEVESAMAYVFGNVMICQGFPFI